MKILNQELELAKLYLERCDTLKAAEFIQPLLEQYLNEQSYDHYLEALHILFRCYAELAEFNKIQQTKEALDKLVSEKGTLTYKSKTYYILAQCACAEKNYELSFSYCQQALELALKNDNKIDASHAILGLAITYYYQGQYEHSLKEIYNLQVFMNVLKLPQVTLSAFILKGQILRKLGKYEQALEVLWHSYESLRKDKNFYYYLTVLYGLGVTLKEVGRTKEARSYLLLAQRSMDPANLVRLSKSIDQAIEELGASEVSIYDMIFDIKNHSVVEKKMGKIAFKNQFILLDLLELFVSHQGQTFSKEDLVKKIWRQSYNPAVHDNKIYVTIKRLRQLIEPSMSRPKYIFRSKEGYYFNDSVSVYLQGNNTEGELR